MTPKEVADAILLLGPGFVLLKAFALAGGQHQRLQWEWVVWSVLLSIPVATATRWLASTAADRLTIPQLLEWEPVERFFVAAAMGVAVGLAWSWVRRSRSSRLRRVYRSAVDSAWDLVLDDATRRAPDGGNYGVEATVEIGGVEAFYYGTLAAFGYERAKAEPWIYLTYVNRWEGEDKGGYQPMERTEGLLLNRDQIKRIRIISSELNGRESPDTA